MLINYTCIKLEVCLKHKAEKHEQSSYVLKREVCLKTQLCVWALSHICKASHKVSYVKKIVARILQQYFNTKVYLTQ